MLNLILWRLIENQKRLFINKAELPWLYDYRLLRHVSCLFIEGDLLFNTMNVIKTLNF